MRFIVFTGPYDQSSSFHLRSVSSQPKRKDKPANNLLFAVGHAALGNISRTHEAQVKVME